MRSRSVLVVLSLLVFAAGSADAARNSRSARQKKAAAQKRAAARKQAVAPQNESGGPTAIGGTRTQATDAPGSRPVKKAVATASNTRAPVKKTARGTSQARTPSTTPAHHASTPVVPAVAAASRFDTTAAVAPRRRFVKVKRFFAGLAIVTALSAGAVGWQAADMNGKVGDAWNYVGDQIEQIFGGGDDGPIGGKPNKGDPKPFPPFPDPGPPLPEPDPQPDPGPSPKGGSGHQSPKGPETDRR